MKALVCGAGGFIGSHLVKRLKAEGYYVVGVDLKKPEFSQTEAHLFYQRDLRVSLHVDNLFAFFNKAIGSIDEVYQLAAQMGGAGYIFTGENDAAIMHDSILINLNIAEACRKFEVGALFFSSSACVYPQELQEQPNNPGLKETDAYPANPDSAYGWEKIFAEQLYEAYERNHSVCTKIARLHNVFGPEGTYQGGREKAPAAICRKIATAKDGDTIEVWGHGQQTRSFLYIDECIEGIRRIISTCLVEPIIYNLGSSEQVSINQLIEMIATIAGKQIFVRHVNGPIGVQGRTSDNTWIKSNLNWAPSAKLQDGIEKTYHWINKQVNA